jgi:predicted PolB exonuclease-like 3'-5' exonuclease
MFKSVHDRVWAFDAEWVPDPRTGSAVYDLPPSMDEAAVLEEMWRRGRGDGDENVPRPYLKTVLCRLVSIVAVIRSAVETEPPLQLYSLPRPGDWHIDLMEILGARSRQSRPSLHEIATACGIPGKFDSGGGDVADLWSNGQIDQIVRYNEFDALTTYLVWLRLAHFGGFFSSDEYEREQALLEEFLKREGTKAAHREHLLTYLSEWQRVRER